MQNIQLSFDRPIFDWTGVMQNFFDMIFTRVGATIPVSVNEFSTVVSLPQTRFPVPFLFSRTAPGRRPLWPAHCSSALARSRARSWAGPLTAPLDR
jgi:hypothetical protein